MSKPSKHFNFDDDGFAQISFVNNNGFKTGQFTLDSNNLSVILTTNPTFDRRLLVVKNESEDGIIVCVGNEDVAAGDGIPLYPGDIMQFPLDEDSTFKAVIAPNQLGSAKVRALETG